MQSGEYRWNAGMFLVRATTLLDLLAERHADLAAGLREIAADPSLLADRWGELTRIAIDHAVAEPAAAEGRVVMVPGPFGWEDLGDYAALAEATAARADGVRVIGDDDARAGLGRQWARRASRGTHRRRGRAGRRRRRRHR